MSEKTTPEFTILMPCLNEENSLEYCISLAKQGIASLGLDAEILIADNGSTDGSVGIAQRCGARVVHVEEKGYGAALLGGINAAHGRYIIMGDADGSYDFSQIAGFVQALKAGNALVMGDRFAGGIEPHAMPPSHKVGVRVLSWLARLRFHTDVYDFHCGLRAFDREKALALDLQCPGMEFAAEMIAKFARSGARIAQTPVVLHRDRRGRRPHLRTIRDGFRHLWLILRGVL